MTEAEKLAALSEAATSELINLDTLPDQIQSLRNHAEERRNKGWLKSAANLEASAYLIETLAAEVATYRANQLVLIGPDAVEVVARAICNAHCEEMYGVIDSHMVENEWADWIPEARAALAALGVK